MGLNSKLNKNLKILRILLLAGSIYFLLVAIFHMVGFKIPPFFIYYNVPSYVYQDRIISFLTFGWSVFLFTAFLNPRKNKMLIQALIIAGVAAIIGLEIINLFTEFESLSKTVNPNIFNIATLGLAFYLMLLIIYYNKSKDMLT